MISSSPEKPTLDVRTWLLRVLFFVVLAFVIGVTVHSLSQPLLSSQHGFRQTQTAISCYWMLKGAPWLEYWTPVLGPPWAIPFEFPLFQWIVSGLCWLTSWPLDMSGRVVSAAFFLASSWAVYSISISLGATGAQRLVLPTVFLASPVLIYWSHAFMIETTALFCGLLFVASIWRIEDGQRVRLWFAVAIIAAMLGAAVKITTFFAFGAAAGLLACLHLLRARTLKVALPVAVAGLASFGALIAWTKCADAAKLQNPLAAHFIDSKALATWNFGTIEQKLAVETWREILSRCVRDSTGSALVLLGAIVLSFFVSRQRRFQLWIALALFLLPFAVFTNLHFIHWYYICANAVFAACGCGIVVVGLLEAGRWKAPLGLALLVAQLGFSASTYLQYSREPDEQVTWVFKLASALRERTAPEEVIITAGLDWSPELAYYAERKMIMLRHDRPLSSPQVQASLANLREHGLRIGALVSFSGYGEAAGFVEEGVPRFGLEATPAYVDSEVRVFFAPRLETPR